MSYSDVRNGEIVGHSEDNEKPNWAPKGAWVRNEFVNEFYNEVTHRREGPVATIDVDGVVYEYTLVLLPDAVERYRDHVLGRIYDEQVIREESGTEFNGLKVETDDKAMTKISNALDRSRGNPQATYKFNGKHGRADLTLQAMEGVATAIREHVQTANDWAYTLSLSVVDAGVTTVVQLKAIEAAIDFTDE